MISRFNRIVNIIKKNSLLSNLNSDNYDSLICYGLKKSTITSLRKPKSSKPTHEVHLAITGDRRGIFPFIYNTEYLNRNNDLNKQRPLFKSFYVLEVPFYYYDRNAKYMYDNYEHDLRYKSRSAEGLHLGGNSREKTLVSIKTSFRQSGKPQLEIGTGSDISSKGFSNLRALAQLGDYLIILKHRFSATYDAIFLKHCDNTNENKELTYNGIVINPKYILKTSHPENYYETDIDIKNYHYPQSNYNKSNIKGYNVIYYGAPGTGKSHKVNSIIGNDNKPNVFRTTFYPDYDYSNFVGQIIPSVNYGGTDSDNNTQIRYDFNPGVFTQALKYALQNPSQPTFLIIEELSRANASAVFGDLFQLLDRTNGISDYAVINHPIAKYLICHGISKKDVPNDKIKIPGNLIILATLNTSDQNVTPMDSAFKRRFSWHYVSTHPNKKLDSESIKNANTMVTVDTGKKIAWFIFYQYINWYITNVLYPHENSENKQIGLFFIKFTNKPNVQIKNSLLQYLWNDVSNAYVSSRKRIFNTRSFGDAYENYGKHQIFSNTFLRGLKVYSKLFHSNDIKSCIRNENTTFPAANRCEDVINAIKGSNNNDDQ